MAEKSAQTDENRPEQEERMMALVGWLNYVPFRDPQQARPAERCGICGREVYAPGGECLYCRVYGA